MNKDDALGCNGYGFKTVTGELRHIRKPGGRKTVFHEEQGPEDDNWCGVYAPIEATSEDSDLAWCIRCSSRTDQIIARS